MDDLESRVSRSLVLAAAILLTLLTGLPVTDGVRLFDSTLGLLPLFAVSAVLAARLYWAPAQAGVVDRAGAHAPAGAVFVPGAGGRGCFWGSPDSRRLMERLILREEQIPWRSI